MVTRVVTTITYKKQARIGGGLLESLNAAEVWSSAGASFRRRVVFQPRLLVPVVEAVKGISRPGADSCMRSARVSKENPWGNSRLELREREGVVLEDCSVGDVLFAARKEAHLLGFPHFCPYFADPFQGKVDGLWLVILSSSHVGDGGCPF
ncbi:hypothetical protein E3N88_25398 [Mikania micrantha]|uniref:Uncharacterized protein n=1 Tax=Mikania micrantha TaxID=192012 RepID=A0A5N6N6A8_9ASTR|nr:hypothetical protein E3N88_25398 [Mikania micrantha]